MCRNGKLLRHSVWCEWSALPCYQTRAGCAPKELPMKSRSPNCNMISYFASSKQLHLHCTRTNWQNVLVDLWRKRLMFGPTSLRSGLVFFDLLQLDVNLVDFVRRLVVNYELKLNDLAEHVHALVDWDLDLQPIDLLVHVLVAHTLQWTKDVVHGSVNGNLEAWSGDRWVIEHNFCCINLLVVLSIAIGMSTVPFKVYQMLPTVLCTVDLRSVSLGLHSIRDLRVGGAVAGKWKVNGKR